MYTAKSVTHLDRPPQFLLRGTFLPAMPFSQLIAFIFVLVFLKKAVAAGASFWIWVMAQQRKTTEDDQMRGGGKTRINIPIMKGKSEVYCKCPWKERNCLVYWSWHDSWMSKGVRERWVCPVRRLKLGSAFSISHLQPNSNRVVPVWSLQDWSGNKRDPLQTLTQLLLRFWLPQSGHKAFIYAGNTIQSHHNT